MGIQETIRKMKTDIEKSLEDKIVKGEAPLGLYECGIGIVLAELGGAELDTIQFVWFDETYMLNNYVTPTEPMYSLQERE